MDTESCNITWLVNITKEGNDVGVCEKTEKVAYMGFSGIEPAVIQNVIINNEDGTCEDGDICLCTSCEYSTCDNITEALTNEFKSNPEVIEDIKKNKQNVEDNITRLFEIADSFIEKLKKENPTVFENGGIISYK